jgi:hypothetical protein
MVRNNKRIPSASSTIGFGLLFPRSCSDIGRGRALFAGDPDAGVALDSSSPCPSLVASSTVTTGGGTPPAVLSVARTSGNTSTIGVRRRPSALRLLSRAPCAPGFVRRASRSRRCSAFAPARPSSSQRTEATLELDDLAERVENADADMPERVETPDAVDGGRSDEPALESEYADDGRPAGAASAARRVFVSAYRPFAGGSGAPRPDAVEEVEALRLPVGRIVPRRSEPGSRPPRASLLGFLWIAAALGRAGLACALGAPASKLLVEMRSAFFAVIFFSLLFFPFSFVFVVAVVGFVCVSFVVACALPSLSNLSAPRVAQLFMRAMERMLRIARRAIEPWPCAAAVSAGAGGASKPSLPLSYPGTVRSVDMDESVPLRWRGAGCGSAGASLGGTCGGSSEAFC